MNNSILVMLLLVAAVLAYFVGGAINDAFHPIYLSFAVLVGGAISLIPKSSGKNATETSSSEAVTDTQTLYVGNLPYRANESAVRELFSEHGKVVSVRLLKDKQTGKRRGFGFVEMAANDADRAIDALNEHEYQQRTLKVRVANERKEG
ncbi:RNA recognition motif domain-containing protein [Aliagarivorans marinus]|uniref:RNA recognition motif domain-containing protein n=1 Tax=Aliagarivorans marinus TaxID=561965 RepID=UPI00054D559F|nr:RNA-binding protein [Aliagarivorans marinus]